MGVLSKRRADDRDTTPSPRRRFWPVSETRARQQPSNEKKKEKKEEKEEEEKK
jgi:hypothetical protein